jgi:hypothetical protein
MASQSLGFVSVIGLNLIDPILLLIEDLEGRRLVKPNQVQANQPENGLSCSIAALSVFLLESAINRTKYLRTKYLTEEEPEVGRSAVDYFAQISSDPDLVGDVEEIFALRDVIAHNHVWEADVEWDEHQKLRFVSDPVLVEGYGDKRFRKVLDPKTRQSKRLRLNLFPARIWRRDAYGVFRKAVEALLALEKMDRQYFYISQQSFLYQKRHLGLSQILDSLPSYD